jgi:hypothetical protein
LGHFTQAIRVFVDGQDPNWRHHLLGRAGFDLVSVIGFWCGVVVALRRFRQAQYVLLLIVLGVLWLPAPLSDPPVHTLRLAGIYPPFYALIAVGLFSVFGWFFKKAGQRKGTRLLPDWYQTAAGGLALALLLGISGTLTVTAYFYRWAGHPDVYRAFDGPVANLVAPLIDPDADVNVIIPYYFYTHATARYFLSSQYGEVVTMPGSIPAVVSKQPQTSLLLPGYPPDDGAPPAYVWLVKDRNAPGIAVVSAINREASASALTSGKPGAIVAPNGAELAETFPVDTQPMLRLFPVQSSSKKTDVIWADNLRLIGYKFVPEKTTAGPSSHLELTWQILGTTGLQERIFLQVLDSQGNPISQQELKPISRKMYRWRDDGLIVEQHPLHLPQDLSGGLYFVRLGFFDPKTDTRLPAFNSNGQPLGDEFIAGPLFVSGASEQPLQPERQLSAKLGDNFELLGYSVKSGEQAVTVTLFWKTVASTETNFTIFLQLLDDQNQVIAQVDTQPLANVYPTSRWQSGEIVFDQFTLPAPVGGHRLITGMYDVATGQRLPIYDRQGQLLPDNFLELMFE